MNRKQLKTFLNRQLDEYYHSSFIESDPIFIPHQFQRKQDREITGFWIAMLAWGRRDIIIRKGKELIEIMDNAPYDFILNHTDKDLKKLNKFKHRTFQPTDALYFLYFLHYHYSRHDSLESAFGNSHTGNIKDRLIYFHRYFFNLEYAPKRTQKHVSTPLKKSACKRLNMFLRWMVRKDEKNIDFGLWDSFQMKELMIPLDVHVNRIARKLNLLKRKTPDWKAVEELTENLRKLDCEDPVKYDYALFNLGLHN